MWQASKIRLRYYIAPLLFLLITVYFMYHLIEGEHGIFRLFSVNSELEKANILLQNTNEEKRQLENRVNLLSSQRLDADMLDEVSREKLGLIDKDEYVIFNQSEEGK